MSIIAAKPPRSISVGRPPAQVFTPVPAEDDGRALPQHELPRTSPDEPWDRVALTAVPASEPKWDEEAPDLRRALPADAPDGRAMVGTIVIFAVEILLGHRPPSALRRWLTPEVFGPLVRRAGLAHRIKGKAPRTRTPRILQVLASQPKARVIEAVTAVHDGQRVRAACLRLEFLRGRWKVVALEIG
ncbi:MAG: Rv3235 family protein [Actinomycetaceae bacterium]|nr:Rv3235 family protein [Actinomycetaceae bacterium]